jgi:hypothetical protein
MRRRPLLLELPVLLTVMSVTVMIGVHAFEFVAKPAPTEWPKYELPPRSLEDAARSNIRIFCGSCHNSGRSGIDFTDATLNVAEMRRDRAAWEEVARRIRTHEMPPRRFPQPTAEQRAEIIEWLDKEVLQAPVEGPAAFRTRRLQRNEYVNTLRDLLGVQAELPEDFPGDEAWSPSSGVRAVEAEALEKYRAVAAKALTRLSFAERQQDGVSCLGPSDAAHAGEFLANFLRRAFRRPVASDELERAKDLYRQAQAEGKPAEECLKTALVDALTSPAFLTRIEDNTGRADPFALASRLSFFLWRSMPDEELMTLAEQGTLEGKLSSQVARLLADPRAEAFATDFAGFWLSLDKVAPQDAEGLRADMRRESEMFLNAILREGRGIRDLIDADFTFVNERLARHYGIQDVTGAALRRVDVRGAGRGGLLAHASVLTIHSSDAETKLVNRGKWVLENLLGAPPIRPPAGLLEAFANSPKNIGSGNTRQLVERHRANPSCAECHRKMDAIGLSLEAFGPLGAWREGMEQISVGDLPDGEALHGLPDLKRYVLKQREALVRALAAKLLQFGLGRKLADSEKSALEDLPAQTAPHDDALSRIVLEVVCSEPFRRGSSE